MAGTSLRLIIYIALAVVLIADIAVPSKHIYFFWDRIPGFNAFYGFSSAVVLIIVAEALAYAGLRQGEDFYD